jgi:hypothetical protein
MKTKLNLTKKPRKINFIFFNLTELKFEIFIEVT